MRESRETIKAEAQDTEDVAPLSSLPSDVVASVPALEVVAT